MIGSDKMLKLPCQAPMFVQCNVSWRPFFDIQQIVSSLLLMKYQLPNNQSEILPNKMGLNSVADIALSEFEGFLKAEILLSESLSKRTKFNVAYILKIHKLALDHLYSFAGKYRDRQ